ncbi:hypothetical protein JVU11DRAFT_9243 [Chiua virens]|nr:hypothetical protein JVU11DRAFT_9243 [Chiua virens]
MFRAKEDRGALSRDTRIAAHNCLIDCHAHVRTHFPVLPAIQHATMSLADRHHHSFLFVTDRDHTRYAPQSAEMIEKFELAGVEEADWRQV